MRRAQQRRGQRDLSAQKFEITATVVYQRRRGDAPKEMPTQCHLCFQLLSVQNWPGHLRNCRRLAAEAEELFDGEEEEDDDEALAADGGGGSSSGSPVIGGAADAADDDDDGGADDDSELTESSSEEEEEEDAAPPTRPDDLLKNPGRDPRRRWTDDLSDMASRMTGARRWAWARFMLSAKLNATNVSVAESDSLLGCPPRLLAELDAVAPGRTSRGAAACPSRRCASAPRSSRSSTTMEPPAAIATSSASSRPTRCGGRGRASPRNR